MKDEDNTALSFLGKGVESLLPPSRMERDPVIASTFVETLQNSVISKNKNKNENTNKISADSGKLMNKATDVTSSTSKMSFSPKMMSNIARSADFHKSKETKKVNHKKTKLDPINRRKNNDIVEPTQMIKSIPMLTMRKIHFYSEANNLPEASENMMFPSCSGCTNHGYSNHILQELATKILGKGEVALPVDDPTIKRLTRSNSPLIFPYFLPCIDHRNNLMTEVLTKNVFKVVNKQLSVEELKKFSNDKSYSTVFIQCVSADLQMSKGVAQTTVDALGGREEIEKILRDKKLKVGQVVKHVPPRSQLAYIFLVTKERVTDPINWEQLVSCFEQIPLSVAFGRYTRLVTVDMACGLDLKRIGKHGSSVKKVLLLLSEINNVLACQKLMYISSEKTLREGVDSGLFWIQDEDVFLHHRIEVLNGSPKRVNNVAEIKALMKNEIELTVSEPLKPIELEGIRPSASDNQDDEDHVTHVGMEKLNALMNSAQLSLSEADDQNHVIQVNEELGISNIIKNENITENVLIKSTSSIDTDKLLQMDSLDDTSSVKSVGAPSTSCDKSEDKTESQEINNDKRLNSNLTKQKLTVEISSVSSKDEKINTTANEVGNIDFTDSGHGTPEKTLVLCDPYDVRFSALENKFKELQVTMKKSDSLIRGLQTTNDTLVLQIGNLNIRIDLLERQVLEKTQIVSELEKQNAELGEVIDELKKTNEIQVNRLSSCDKQIEELKGDRDDYKNLLIFERKKNENNDEKIQELEHVYEDILNKNGILQNSNDALTVENKKLMIEINEQKKTNDAYVLTTEQRRCEILNGSNENVYINKSTQSFLLANTYQLRKVREAIERIDKISLEICADFDFHIHCRNLVTNAGITALNNIGRTDVIIPRNRLLRSQLLEYGVMPKDFTKIKHIFDKSELIGLSCDADAIQVQTYMDGYV